VWDAIEESNHLHLKIDTLQQQYSKAMVEDKEMSKKIEILEDELVEKENTIMNLRKKNTMTREEIEEELGKITKGQEKKLDDQTAMIKQQNEKIDFLADTLMKVLKSQEKK
jgi:coproporphyrinogen III oxidase-like Fe-S oxidoreductase